MKMFNNDKAKQAAPTLKESVKDAAAVFANKKERLDITDSIQENSKGSLSLDDPYEDERQRRREQKEQRQLRK